MQQPARLRLAFSSNAYLDVPVETAIARVAGLGYRGIELLADVPHAWPAGLLDVQKEAIRRSIRESGLVISNINAFMMNAIADPRRAAAPASCARGGSRGSGGRDRSTPGASRAAADRRWRSS